MEDDAPTQASAVLTARPGAVLAVLADLARYPEWATGTTEVEVVGAGDGGRPSRAGFRVAGGPLRGRWTLAYTWDVRPDGTGTVAWSLVTSDVLRALDGAHELRAVAEGTRVTSILRVETKVPLLAALRRRAERFVVERLLCDLRDRLAVLGTARAHPTPPAGPAGPDSPSSPDSTGEDGS